MTSGVASWDEYLRSFPKARFAAATGHLPERLVLALRTAVMLAPVIPFTNVVAPGVEVVALNQAEVEQLNREHSYRALDGDTKSALRDIFANLKEPIANLLDSPWRVLNCRSWTTLKGASIGPNDWHLDGDHPGILKLMIYATPTGGEYGGIEFLDARLNGEDWIVFYSSVVRLRGIAPSVEGLERVATEVTLCQSHDFYLEPRFLGLAARKPKEP